MLKKIDKTLLIASVVLFVIGLIMIYSASNVTSFMQQSRSSYYYVARQFAFLIVSFGVSYAIFRFFNTKSYSLLSWPLMIVIIVLLVVVLLYGHLSNQARSWIKIIPGVTLQPSEFIKVATIVWMSSFYLIIRKKPNYKSFLLLFGIIILVALLIVLQPDLGTASIYLGIVFFMFLSLPLPKKVRRNIALTCIAGIGIVVLLLMNNGVQLLFDRQLERFDYFNPCSEEKFYDSGTQVCNGFIAFNNGGLLGKGLGNSTQKYLYLPEAYTDFIFAITAEELGVVGSIAILGLMMVVLWRIFIIGKYAKTEENRLMCYGIFWYILLHIIVNLGGVTGIIPLTGVPLPFLSYGGSFCMCLIVALTLVQKVAAENKAN